MKYLVSGYDKGGVYHALNISAPSKARAIAQARAQNRQVTDPKGRVTKWTATVNNPSGVRIVHNKLLGDWYVVRGPHQTPLNGRFNSKAEAQAWLDRKKNPSQVATLVARGNKKVFVIATDSSESNEALLNRANAIRVIKRVNTNPQRANITKGSEVVITVGGRSVRGIVTRVNNRPLADGSIDKWDHWDLEYTIKPSGDPGRWKQNVDGGNVALANPSPLTEWDFEDLADEGAKMGSQVARALGQGARAHAKEPKRYNVTWYSPRLGKRTGFIRPIEADTQAAAKAQAKAMITNDPKASNFIAKEAKRNPTRTSTEVRSPTKTSTWAKTEGNITVTGGAGKGATTKVIVNRKPNPHKARWGYVATVVARKGLLLGGVKRHTSSPFSTRAMAQDFITASVETNQSAGVDAVSGGIQKIKTRQPLITPDGISNPEMKQGAVTLLKTFWGHKQGVRGRIVKRGGEYQLILKGSQPATVYPSDIGVLFRYGDTKTNPATAREMSERFNGQASGRVTELKASNRAPRDLSRAGKLVFLKLVNAKAQLRIPGAVVCIDPKTERLWIAGNRTPLLNKRANPGEALDFGEIDRICYETAKAHIGDGKTVEYVHTFGEDGGRKPRLQVDAEGMPVIVGGDYKIKAEGIVN